MPQSAYGYGGRGCLTGSGFGPSPIRSHVSELSIADGASCFWEQFRYVATPNWPLWVAALLGALLLLRSEDAKGERWFLWAYSAFSFFCICPGFFFRPHYFIVFLPAVAIFSGAAGSWLLHFAGRWQPGKGRGSGRQQPAAMARHARQNARARASKAADAGAAVPGILLWPAAMMLLAAAAFGVWWQGEFFFLWTPTRACREMYGPSPFVASTVIADYVSRHTTPDQRLAVLGSEPQLYFYAKRRAATGHIYVYPLVERQPFAQQLQQEMCREIEAARPEFIVLVHVDLSWMAEPDCSRFLYQWADRYLEKNYRPVGLADIISAAQTDYQWGDQAAQAHSRSPYCLWVFQRKKGSHHAFTP